MNIASPYARLVSFSMAEEIGWKANDPLIAFTASQGENLLRKIEWCSRISHRSEEAQTLDSWKRFIKFVVIDKGDWSVVEHASVSVDFLVNRGITHEIVWHRLFSFTQESTRFVNYEKKMPASFVRPVGVSQTTFSFNTRSIFPNALAARLIMTGNLRNWRYFLIMRTTKETHPQMKEVTIPLLEEFKLKIPILFDDIEPDQYQSVAISKPR